MAKKIRFNFERVCKMLVLGLLLTGCAAPYKLMPEFESRKDQIQRIAMYPLYYTDKGKEQSMFGNVFTKRLFDAVKTMPLVKPVDFIPPDSTVSVFECVNISLETGKDSIVTELGTLAYFPVYKPLASNEIRQISETVDGLLYCDLKLYNEVEFAKQIAQAMLTACLTLGMVSVFEKSVVQMDITLFETKTGKPIWTYTPNIEISAVKPKLNAWCLLGLVGAPGYLRSKSLEEQRNEMTEGIIRGFRKGFPFSEDFQIK